MNWPDFAERMLWTFVLAALANLTGAALLDLDQAKAAALTGLTAVFQAVSLVARKRLAVLPDPGDGLPGLPVKD